MAYIYISVKRCEHHGFSFYQTNVSLSATWKIRAPKLIANTIIKNGSVPIYYDTRLIQPNLQAGVYTGDYLEQIALRLDTTDTIYANDNLYVEYYTSAAGPDPGYGWDGKYGRDGSYSYALNQITTGPMAPIDEFAVHIYGLPSIFRPHIIVNGNIDIASWTITPGAGSGGKLYLGPDWWFVGVSTGGVEGSISGHVIKSISAYIENTDIIPSTKSVTL